MKMKYLKLKILLLVTLFAALAFAQIRKNETDAFSSAEMFPSGALIYAQFQDLPAILKLWNESKLKENYLNSTNFQEFSNRHLALKLAERFADFNEALGFPLDSAAMSSSSEAKAAFAVYDIGRMEMVFIAPISEEKILASLFFQNFSQFEETEIENGLKFYSREFSIDRGREKQTVLFANADGYFVLATSKPKFLKTLENISGKSKNESLWDEPEFKDLTKKVSPHLATFWVNQEKLNDDWYFKHYWLMKNVEDLQKIRAGIFDFEMRDNEIFEHRVFLRTEKKNENLRLSPSEISNLQSSIPNETAFYKIESGFDLPTINQVLFDSYSKKAAPKIVSRNYYRGYYDSEYEDYFDYYNLGSDFDAQINEVEDSENFDSAAAVNETNKQLFSELEKIFAAAAPKSSTYLIAPQNLPMPMFFECRKAVIFSLQRPQNINRVKLENAISELAKNHLMLGDAKEQIVWKNLTENQITGRELSMPMLRWNFYYLVKDNKIIFSNSSEFLTNIINNSADKKTQPDKLLDNLTVIRLEQREMAFDRIMKKLKTEENKNSPSNSGKSDFFVDNIGSLLDLTSRIKQIEIRRNSEDNYLFEELRFVY